MGSLVRTFKFWLRPTPAQGRVLDAWRLLCCTLYNAALEQRITAWRTVQRSISYVYQCRELTELRNAEESWGELPVEAARSALRRLQRAFEAFFRRCKAGETPGFPRFRSRDRYDSFGVGRVTVEYGRVRIPNLGWVKFKAHQPLRGVVRDVQVRRGAKRWFVCIACDLGEAPPKRVVSTATGIDLGLTSFAVLSNGEEVENPRHLRRGADVLARRQRALAQKRRGSRSRRRARQLVARAHEHVRNQRLDFHRKLAKDLCSRYDLVAHEALNIRGMARGLFPKSVHDAGWGQFISILGCKAEEAGVHLIAVNPNGTTQRCSACGATVGKTLADREHRCSCGLVLGRDHNAALNVLALGLSAVPAATQTEASRF